jgi:hypothetical protein
MDPSVLHLTNLLVRWIVLYIAFYSLIYLMRKNVNIEGLLANLFFVFLWVPGNAVLSLALSYHVPDINPYVTFIGMVFLTNLVLLYTSHKMIPGIEIRNFGFILLIVAGCTAITTLVHVYIPLLPPLRIG